MRGIAVAAPGERTDLAMRGTVARAGAALRMPARASALAMLASVAALASFAWCAGGAEAADELNLYSHRQPFLIEPFLEAFTAETGVEVNVVYASKGLAQRLQAEGRNSPADVVLTVDIGRLAIYADKDLLAPVESAVLEEAVPAHLRDPDGRWFALSKRARVIAVSKDGVPEGAIQRYEDLADPEWAGRICTRPRQPCLQPGSDGLHDRRPRGGGGRGVGHRPRRQPRPPPPGQRSRAGEGDLRGLFATLPSLTATITASLHPPRSRSSGHGPRP